MPNKTTVLVDINILLDGLQKREPFFYRDYEDAVQMISAVQCKADCLITCNIEDYQPPLLSVLKPVEFLATI